MNDIKPAMKLIGGVEPTAQQVQRVQAIAHSLGIASNDPMLPILIALDAYHGAFSSLPAKAQTAANAAATGAAEQSKVAVNEAIAKAILNLSPQVGKAIEKVAGEVADVGKLKWIGGVVVIVVLAFSLFGELIHTNSYQSGFESGKAEGYKQAADEKAALAWANTLQGKLAYQLAQAGSLELLAHCNGKGWKLSKGICFPMSTAEGKDQMVYGWSVGPAAVGNPTRKTHVSWWEHLMDWGDA